MRVSRLELQGFKSFAKKTELSFPEGITAIIGPNGSGKSNISDSIRWVLGEQSAKSLRGGKMEDVIFNGTQKRRPLPMAEVSLVFDNRDKALPVDYAEVAVTRRVYRSGESEYAINRKNCRLKDILELFRDTGIGKDGYSIISQGKVDEILSNRSQDRRAALEEAAGVMGYRVKREEAQRKLEQTRKNMERLLDILNELEGRLGPLKRQSEKARKALGFQEELKELEVNLFLRDSEKNRQKLTEQKQALSLLEENLQQNRQEDEALLLSAEAWQQQLDALDKELEQQQNELVELSARIEGKQGEGSLLEEKKQQLHRELERLHSLIEEGEGRQQQLHCSLQQLSEQGEGHSQQLQRELQQQEQLLSQLQQQTQTAEDRIEGMKAAIMESMNRLSDMKSSLSRFETMESTLQSRQQAIIQEQQRYGKEEAGFLQELEAAGEEQRAILKALDIGKQQLQQAKDALLAAQREDRSHRDSLMQTEQAIAALSSRLRVLHEMVKKREGYQNALRLILEEGDRDPALRDKIIGVVAECIRTPRQLETAISTVLGGAAQNLITATGRDAKFVIDRARRGAFGRITVLPLDLLRVSPLKPQEERLLSEPGILGLASQMVSCNSKVGKAIDYLLGRTLIAEDMNAALQLKERFDTSLQIVTLQGDMIHGGGAMSGGKGKRESLSLIGREREIEELTEQLKNKNREREELKQLIQTRLSSLESLSRQQESLVYQLHQGELQLEKQKDRLSLIQRDIERSRQQQEALLEEEESNRESLLSLQKSILACKRDSSSLEEGSSVTREDVQQAQKAYMALRQQKEQQWDKVSSLKLSLLAAQKEADAREKEKQRLLSLQQQEQALTERYQRETEAGMGQLAVLEQQKEDLQQQLTALQEGKELKLQSNREARSKRSNLMEELGSLRQKREQLLTHSRSLLEHKSHTEMLLGKLQTQLEQMQDRIWNSYELTYENALSLYKDIPLTAANSRIGELKTALKALGEVNPGAIKEYGELTERHGELKKQYTDVAKAADDLENLTESLLKSMEKLFISEFDRVKKEFSEVFSQLFKGGQAELRLSDPKDVLGCDIDIIAQPPGKKLQMLSLLSGGERALTAIALLFAMLRIKSPAFCVLDEIEAALDEANVDRFADFLRDYSQNTQFILITHRKGSMEACNTLYGVAMEEKGVSSIVSARFEA